MELRCLKCKEERIFFGEDVINVGRMIEKHNLSVSAFLDALAPFGGECNDGDLHIYEFSDSFRDEMHQLAKRFGDASKSVEDNSSELVKLVEERKVIESKIREIGKSINGKMKNLDESQKEIAAVKEKCVDLTGMDKIEMWR